MITREELNPKRVPLATAEMRSNFELSYERANLARKAYGKPWRLTNGVRDVADHRRIYIAKAKKLGVSIDSIRIPMGSCHLKAAAWDIEDKDGSLYKWCEDNEELLRSIGIWIERGTVGWVHMQVLPFGSYTPTGSIFFNP